MSWRPLRWASSPEIKLCPITAAVRPRSFPLFSIFYVGFDEKYLCQISVCFLNYKILPLLVLNLICIVLKTSVKGESNNFSLVACGLKRGQISAHVIGHSDHVVYLGVPKTQVASNRPTECRPDNCQLLYLLPQN